MRNYDGERLMEKIRSGKCEVLGLGISNVPLCKWLVAHGADVTGRDLKSEQTLEAAGELRSLGVKLVTGPGYLDGIGGDGTVIFRSPGIRPDVPEIKAAVDAGAVLTSEMELFLALTPASVIALTGSDGKTTSTTLTYMFSGQNPKGKVYVGGNIGEPLLPKVEQMTEDDIAVLELSSFQLMTMRDVKLRIRTAITNISPNHLNWHTDMDEYIKAKENICFGTSSERLVTNAENEITRNIAKKFDGTVVLFSSKRHSYDEIAGDINPDYVIYLNDKGIIVLDDGSRAVFVLDSSKIKLPGVHNVENYMTAIGLTFSEEDIAGLNERYLEVAETFGGVEHRLEFVREKDGVKYYNSSIDSSPSRTRAALSAIDKPMVVLCGGRDKHVPFAPMADALCDKAVGVVLFGEAADKIGEAITECPKFSPDRFPLYHVPDFDAAVRKAAEVAKEGQVVLLSPGCTSFDAFRNFEERGRRFKEIIKGLE